MFPNSSQTTLRHMISVHLAKRISNSLTISEMRMVYDEFNGIKQIKLMGKLTHLRHIKKTLLSESCNRPTSELYTETFTYLMLVEVEGSDSLVVDCVCRVVLSDS